MKKWVIGSLVGAFLVFGWQSLSWTFLGVHKYMMRYTPKQGEVMNALSANLPDEGFYMMPSAPTEKERKALQDSLKGKPWATIIYHKEYKMDMVMPLIRCFLVDIFLVISLIYVLTRGGVPIARRVFSGSVAWGLAFFLWGPYIGHIFFQLPWEMIKGDLIDALVAWSLCGIWLAWWLNRNKLQPKAE